QRSVNRTTPTPSPWSVVTRSERVPGPYMSQASSWMPKRAPVDACTGNAATSASATTKAAPSPRRMREERSGVPVRLVLARCELEDGLAAAGADRTHDVRTAVEAERSPARGRGWGVEV